MIWMRISEADEASTEKTAGGVMTGVSGAGDSVGEWARSDEDISGHSSVDDDPASACGGVEY